MSNIVDQLTSMIVGSEQDITNFVHYTRDTGELFKVSRRSTPVDGYDNIEVMYSTVKEILSGKKRMSEFKVEYDTASKQLSLTEQTYETALADVTNKLHIIDSALVDADVSIIKNIADNTLLITVSDEVRADRQLSSIADKINLHFSVTAINDPNVLYESFTCVLSELLKDDPVDMVCHFLYNSDISSISIYTTKYFNSYSIETV